jgi:hypothetical protein
MLQERKEKKRTSPVAKRSISMGDDSGDWVLFPIETMNADSAIGNRMLNQAKPLRDIQPFASPPTPK